MIKYLFVFVFIFVFAWFDKSLGYTTTSPVYTHFTYMFQHAGIIHLVINSLAFIGMFRAVEKYINKWILSGICIFFAFLLSFFSSYDIPTVGASSMIYIMIGMFLSITLFYKKVKINDKRKYLLFITSIFLSLLVSAFKHNSNFLLHVLSISSGIIIGLIFLIKKSFIAKTKYVKTLPN